MFTNEQLQAMIRQEIVSEQYPYSTKDEQELKNYLKSMLAELERMKIRCNVEDDHFGSGYASYMSWFCYEDASIQVVEDGVTRSVEMHGLHVLISRLAPVVVIGNAYESSSYLLKTGNYLGGGNSMLSAPDDLTIAPPFQALANTLERILMKYQFTMLRKEDLAAPLPFEADIPTLFRSKGRYLVWDAVFYWED